MDDDSITDIDLPGGAGLGSVDTLNEMGLTQNSLVLLPEWIHFVGH